MEQSKALLQQLIIALQCLPSVGRKSAQRMAYYLLDKDRQGGLHLAKQLEAAMQNIGNCTRCRDYTEREFCGICQNDKRDASLLCIVESPADVAAIEATGTYSGKYFVLMGNLSPLDGIGPEEIGLDQLRQLLQKEACEEIIVATSATVEGEATAHFISSMVQSLEGRRIHVSRLAQGVPMGGELEYLDASTLSMSLANRKHM
jgi:recombination protein RecR